MCEHSDPEHCPQVWDRTTGALICRPRVIPLPRDPELPDE